LALVEGGGEGIGGEGLVEDVASGEVVPHPHAAGGGGHDGTDYGRAEFVVDLGGFFAGSD
jgi:hypothetical protein